MTVKKNQGMYPLLLQRYRMMPCLDLLNLLPPCLQGSGGLLRCVCVTPASSGQNRPEGREIRPLQLLPSTLTPTTTRDGLLYRNTWVII